MPEPREPASARSKYGPTGEERPAFILEFPQNETLEPFIELFEQGNFYELRRRAASLDSSSLDPRVRDAIANLVSRTEPDPLLKWMLLFCFLLLVATVAWVYLH